MSESEHPGRWPVKRAEVPVINNLPWCDQSEVIQARDHILQVEGERDHWKAMAHTLQQENAVLRERGSLKSEMQLMDKVKQLQQENAALRKRVKELEEYEFMYKGLCK